MSQIAIGGVDALVMNWPWRALRTVLIMSILALAAPAVAQASHLQGGYFNAGVTASGHLEGTLTFLYRNTGCSVGETDVLTFALEGPDSGTDVEVPAEITRCLGDSATMRGTFDVDLSAHPDGVYELTFSTGDWVGGIVNSPGSQMTFRAAVRKSSLGVTGTPNLSSEPARGIAVGYPYSQNLNAADPDGGTLTYESLVAPHEAAPSSSVIEVSEAGQVTIPASTTAGFTNGQRYVYKVRVTDGQGDYAERDVLLTVTDQNAPPSIAGLEPGYEIAPGELTEIEVTATDPDAEDTVDLDATGLPDWATLEVTPGNPAAATLVLEPPVEADGATAGINLDAFDDNPDVPLMGSANTVLTVKAPASEPEPEPDRDELPKLSLVDAKGGLAGVIEVAGDSTTVGCAAPGAALQSCAADIRLRGRSAGIPGAIVSARRLLGRGARQLSGTSRARVRVQLTKAGKRLVRRTLGGVPVRVSLRAITAEGDVLTAHRNARMRRERQIVMPADGLFGVRGTDLRADGRRLVAAVAKRVKGATRVTCTGHADGTATPDYGLALGAERARVVCAALRRHGFRGALRTRSRGISRPRADNDTAAGRALNRRVELSVDW